MDNDIVILSVDEWNGIQRLRHRITQHFSKEQRILFVEDSNLSLFSIFRDPRRMKRLFKLNRIRKLNNNILIYTPFLCLPFWERNYTINRINNFLLRKQIKKILSKYNFKNIVMWYFFYCHASNVGKFNEVLSVYTAHDVWEENNRRPRNNTLKMEQEVIQSVDLSFFTSLSNYENKKVHSQNCIYTPHGAPSIGSKGILRPNDLPKKGRILGYWGSVDSSSIDLQLVEKLSQKFRHDNIVFVGMYPRVFQGNINKLNQFKNVHFLGMKDQDQMTDYLSFFDVGLVPYPRIPFRLKCSPLKVYDYMAHGIPTVSIDNTEIESIKDLVYIARDEKEFITKIRCALTEDVTLKEKRIQFCMENSWEKRMEQLKLNIEVMLK